MTSPESVTESATDSSNSSFGTAGPEVAVGSAVTSPTPNAFGSPLSSNFQVNFGPFGALQQQFSSFNATGSQFAYDFMGTPSHQHSSSTVVQVPVCNGSLSPASMKSAANVVLSANLTRCPLCGEIFDQPKVLACFHTFCKPCLEKQIESPGRINCPQCSLETQICTDQGVDSLLSDFAVINLQEQQKVRASSYAVSNSSSPTGDRGCKGDDGNQRLSATSNATSKGSGAALQTNCTGCKSKETLAVAHCYDCTNYLCTNCVMAHQYMHCFEGHRVVDLSQVEARDMERMVRCLQHRQEPLQYFCFSCNVPVCKECVASDHPRNVHHFEPITDVGTQQVQLVQQLLEEAKAKQVSLVESFKSVDTLSQRLNMSFQKASQEIMETASLLQQVVEEQRQQVQRELENAFNGKQVALNLVDRKLQQTMEKLSHTIDFTTRLLKYTNPTETLLFKKLLENRLTCVFSYNPDVNAASSSELEFVPNIPASRLAIMNTFGYVRQCADIPLLGKSTLAPISRPTVSASSGQQYCHPSAANLPISLSGHVMSVNGNHQMGSGSSSNPGGLIPSPPHVFGDSNLLQSKQYGDSSQSLGPFSNIGSGDAYSYEKWSTGGIDASGFHQPSSGNPLSCAIHQPIPGLISDSGIYTPSPLGDHQNGVVSGHQVVELSAKLMSTPITFFPPKSQIKRLKMIYHCKFGEFGVSEAQFTEPSGVAVSAQNDIIVADTNNHRIQIFDKEGRFKFQFGECGKRDGQLLYPNRVAVNRVSGDIVVTERSPTHQIQVYNQYGQFLRKFGANILQHPRGVTVDYKGRVVVVECKVMRVIIFDMYGNVLQKFGCSKYLEFPNGVVTNDRQEIFVSDNRAHSVKVFNYEGVYLRQIGGEGLTNYPIGVGINHLGEVVVADNHNNFNLTMFTQDGNLINALESKVKHAQCFDVALLDDGSVVLASKDYRLYIYRYLQVSPLGV
ncbi:B box type zinc finger protein ncl 1 [Trichuris trichiura]|uniref:B box type zinc finger protein ncl 1 n=1 Tax=Trichuris trichiura TaxID=36087 RepID=A0A077Z4J3_TRITR|nr:B box type zinc finger protein ncl 1 [Trichuris trichiura]